MAQYQNLLAAIADVIKTNGREEITGQVLQDVLVEIVNVLGTGAKYAGVASPTTDPGEPDGTLFWLAVQPGQYENMGGFVLDGRHPYFIVWNGEWHAEMFHVLTEGAMPIQPGDGDNSAVLFPGSSDSRAEGEHSVSLGVETITRNDGELAAGRGNVSNTGPNAARRTAFSIGIEGKNAIEVMENGDVYIYGLGGYDGTMQDNPRPMQAVILNNVIEIACEVNFEDDFSRLEIDKDEFIQRVMVDCRPFRLVGTCTTQQGHEDDITADAMAVFVGNANNPQITIFAPVIFNSGEKPALRAIPDIEWDS